MESIKKPTTAELLEMLKAHNGKIPYVGFNSDLLDAQKFEKIAVSNVFKK